MSQKIMPKQAVIAWRDATYYPGYDQSGLITMYTCGFVVAEDDECLTLAHDFHEDGTWRNSSSIPKVNIQKVFYLRKGK